MKTAYVGRRDGTLTALPDAASVAVTDYVDLLRG